MKKILALLLVLLLFVSNVSAFPVSAKEISVYFNDVKIETEVAPCVIDGSTVVPVREICNALGCFVEWDEVTQSVIIEKENVKNVLTIGKTEAKRFVNGAEQHITLQVPAQIISGKTMVPLRYIAESIGADVYWNGEEKTVAIYMSYVPWLCLPGEQAIRPGDYAYTLPTPQRVDLGKNKLQWYVYNKDYKNYKLIAVKDDIVVGFYTFADGFTTNIGVNYGIESPEQNVDGYDVKVYRNNDKVVGVLVLKKDCFGSADITSDEYIQSQATQLFEITNAFRVSNGYEILGWDDTAGYIAAYHSDDMAVHNFYNHTGIDGKGVMERFDDASSLEWTAIGENLSSGLDNAIDIMDDLIESPGQKAHMLSNVFKCFGTGVAYANMSDYKYYATQVFVAY